MYIRAAIVRKSPALLATQLLWRAIFFPVEYAYPKTVNSILTNEAVSMYLCTIKLESGIDGNHVENRIRSYIALGLGNFETTAIQLNYTRF